MFQENVCEDKISISKNACIGILSKKEIYDIKFQEINKLLYDTLQIETQEDNKIQI